MFITHNISINAYDTVYRDNSQNEIILFMLFYYLILKFSDLLWTPFHVIKYLQINSPYNVP